MKESPTYPGMMKVKRLGILLIAVALIAGMMGCDPALYRLTISSTAGGSVTTPGEGAFTYEEGTVIGLMAEAADDHYFVDWTGDVMTVDNTNSPITTITIQDNYAISANFEQIPPGQFVLTIYSTTGGSVMTPGEGTFTYDEGTVVSLVANRDSDYRFVNWTGDVSAITDVDGATTNITMNGNYVITANFEAEFMVSAGSYYTLGLKDNGTVVAVGESCCGQCDVTNWTDIIQVAAGWYHTVGLKPDGTAVAVGLDSSGQRNVGNWTGITQVSTDGYHTLGLKNNGTVVALGDNSLGQCNVSEWTDITQVTAGYLYTVGLKTDGTVVASGDNNHGQCNVNGWAGIVQVAAGHDHTVGLKNNGTVVAVGGNSLEQCNIDSWTNIVQISACGYHTIGLKSNGTVISAGYDSSGQCDVDDWMDIIQVTAGYDHTVGLKSDGTVVAVGNNEHGQCEISDWDLN